VGREIRFHTSEGFPDLKLHCRTTGAPTGAPVLILQDATGSGAKIQRQEVRG